MKPVVDGLKAEVESKWDVKVMNLSQGDPTAGQLADALKIEYVPSFVFVNSDGSVANTIVGGTTEDALLAEFGKLK